MMFLGIHTKIFNRYLILMQFPESEFGFFFFFKVYISFKVTAIYMSVRDGHTQELFNGVVYPVHKTASY